VLNIRFHAIFCISAHYEKIFFSNYRQRYYEGWVKSLALCASQVKTLGCYRRLYDQERNIADENRSTLVEGINLVMTSAAEEKETIFPWSLARETDKWSARPVQKQPSAIAIEPFRGRGSATLWFMPPLSRTNGTTTDQSLINYRRRFLPSSYTYTLVYMEKTILA